MLLAYLDEVGSTGAFIHPSHQRYSDSPAFGYGGFLIPADEARNFGAIFARKKRESFVTEIPSGVDPGRWEKKGADLLYALVSKESPQNLRLLAVLFQALRDRGGHLFYYAEEKPVGSPKMLHTGKVEYREREYTALFESLNRIARHADHLGQNVLILMDQIDEKARRERLASMYAHILGRAADHPEMKRIIEPPMHVDSQLASNIQFADWVCAFIKRAIEYQLVEDSRYTWVAECVAARAARGMFTYDSKLHLCKRSISDLHHTAILSSDRVLFDSVNPTLSPENLANLQRVRDASFSAS